METNPHRESRHARNASLQSGHADAERPPISHSDWYRQLSDLVMRECSQGSVIIVGVGHPLRADDYAGSLVAKDLLREPGSRGTINIIDAENSPENILHVMWNTNPRLVVLIDSLEAGLAPGSTTLVDADQTTYPYFSTHNIPMRVLLEASPTRPRALILGIQPASHEIGESLSEEVENARRTIVRELREIINAARGEPDVG